MITDESQYHDKTVRNVRDVSSLQKERSSLPGCLYQELVKTQQEGNKAAMVLSSQSSALQ
jgi:hypothetical protein